jgi:SAM-dependent methyltransferase
MVVTKGANLGLVCGNPQTIAAIQAGETVVDLGSGGGFDCFLAAEKQKVYDEAFRVLRPGGRLAISDIVALQPLPDHIKQDLDLVSACVGGAATVADIENMLRQAGFAQIRVSPAKVTQEIVDAWLPGSQVGEYVAPAGIEARKPAVSPA